jgi:glucosamine--fructose-6-phosphate aminotransferase (isomerizing)
MIPTKQLAGCRYVRDILDQPGALARTLDALERAAAPGHLVEGVARGRFRKVVLTGMGSSFHALYPLHLRLVECGVPSLLVETSELLHYMPSLLGPGSLLVVVSQSGESAEILRLLEMAPHRLPVVGVTNTPSSALARQSEFAVVAQAGEEATVSTKTYVASLAALEWLGAALSGADPAPLLAALHRAVAFIAEYLAAWETHVDSLTGFLEGVGSIFLVGRGRSLAAAGTGGLILKESAHFPAEGMSSAAFRHGPLEMVRPDVLVGVFAGQARTVALNRSLADDVARWGGKLVWIGEDADLHAWRIAVPSEETRTIMEILPVQIMSLALAASAGHEPGVFVHLKKVTSVE